MLHKTLETDKKEQANRIRVKTKYQKMMSTNTKYKNPNLRTVHKQWNFISQWPCVKKCHCFVLGQAEQCILCVHLSRVRLEGGFKNQNRKPDLPKHNFGLVTGTRIYF